MKTALKLAFGLPALALGLALLLGVLYVDGRGADTLEQARKAEGL